jgi:hypothetical protein
MQGQTIGTPLSSIEAPESWKQQYSRGLGGQRAYVTLTIDPARLGGQAIMKGMRVFFALGLIHLSVLTASAQQTLYVNGTTGNDAVPRANNSASTPWRTIGRAAWGSTNRSAPNAGEAARAGDTVLIAGGTYTTSVAVNDRWGIVYNPANSGQPNQYITFTCVGDCILGAPNANAPVIGSDGKNYIKWFADVAQGHTWQIQAYAPQSGSASATQVNTAPDTGPVVCHGATGCWIEGADIDGGVQTDYTDNYNGIRIENAPSTVARNNTIRNVRNLANTGNGSAFTIYGSPNTIVENNYATNVGSAVGIKDNPFTLPQNNMRIRYNKFDGVDRCFSWSTTTEDRNYIYQNVCVNAIIGLIVTGGGLTNDWIFNNTFYNISGTAVYPTSMGAGGRFWNNIVVNANRVVLVEAGSMPGTNVIDLQHNVYSGHPVFYSGADANRSLSQFRGLYGGQESIAPLSIEANPLFVNAPQGDFRLCTGAGQPAASCTGASPALAVAVDIFDLDGDGSTTDVIRAGATITGSEVFGVPNGIQRPSPPTNVRIITQ